VVEGGSGQGGVGTSVGLLDLIPGAGKVAFSDTVTSDAEVLSIGSGGRGSNIVSLGASMLEGRLSSIRVGESTHVLPVIANTTIGALNGVLVNDELVFWWGMDDGTSGSAKRDIEFNDTRSAGISTTVTSSQEALLVVIDQPGRAATSRDVTGIAIVVGQSALILRVANGGQGVVSRSSDPSTTDGNAADIVVGEGNQFNTNALAVEISRGEAPLLKGFEVQVLFSAIVERDNSQVSAILSLDTTKLGSFVELKANPVTTFEFDNRGEGDTLDR